MKLIRRLRFLPIFVALLVLSPYVFARENSPPAAGTNELLFSTFIGGVNWDEGEAIARDPAGNVYVAGQTLSTFFPTGFNPVPAGVHAVESFVGRLDWTGSSLDYINVYAADVEDWGAALAVDAVGNAYFAGETDSTDYPTTPGAYDRTPNGGFDVFLMKVAPDGELIYSTLLGGGEEEALGAIVVDAAGAVYLTGSTSSDGSGSAVFPTTANAYEPDANGGRDVFLARISPDGSSLEYSTFLGGSGSEGAEALALFNGVLYMAGWTTSADFDTPSGGYDTVKNGTFDAFIAALTPGSSSLVYWTYLGGTDDGVTGDRVLDMAIDGSGSAVVGGGTYADDFPITPGAFDQTYDDTCELAPPPANIPCSDGFIAKLSADGRDLLWATYLGAEGDDSVEAFDLNTAGEVILTGTTASDDFPVSPDAFDDTLDGLLDVFVFHLSAAGDAMLYSTYLGGSADENGNDIWVDPNGWITLTGWSDSADFPTTPGAYDPQLNAFQDVFVTVLVPANASPLQRIYLPLVSR